MNTRRAKNAGSCSGLRRRGVREALTLAVMLLSAPVDCVAWTPRVAELAQNPDLKAPQRGVWLTGQLSSHAKRELTTLGWAVHEEGRWLVSQPRAR